MSCTIYLALIPLYFKIISNFTRLRLAKLPRRISKYHLWYLCQRSLQIMLLPILIYAIIISKTEVNFTLLLRYPYKRKFQVQGLMVFAVYLIRQSTIFSILFTDLKADDLKQQQQQKYQKVMHERISSDPLPKRRKTFA